MREWSSAYTRRVFVDTSAYFALFNGNDVHHARIRALFQSLGIAGSKLFTTNFILAETHALLLNRLGRTIATSALNALDQSASTRLRVSLADDQRARAIITHYADKDFSLTDAMSFAVMERLRIHRALSLDDHFAQYGFTLVREPV